MRPSDGPVGGAEFAWRCRTKKTLIAAVVLLGLSAFASPGWAQVGVQFGNVHQSHFLTFDAPVTLPNGTALPAGTYLFSWDPKARVTRISSEDQSKVYALLQTIEVQRANYQEKEGIKEHDIIIERATATAPPTLKAWFCPGNRIGHEFVSVKK